VSYRLYLRPEAESEIGETAIWYTRRGIGLGADFLDEVSKTLSVLRDRPDRFPIVEGEIRKTLLRRFPYVVLFSIRGDAVVVISCFHTRRDPTHWRDRLP
jgi:plasmid stabilization system protein ParE